RGTRSADSSANLADLSPPLPLQVNVVKIPVIAVVDAGVAIKETTDPAVELFLIQLGKRVLSGFDVESRGHETVRAAPKAYQHSTRLEGLCTGRPTFRSSLSGVELSV